MYQTAIVAFTLLGLAPWAAQADLQLDDDYSATCRAICRPVHQLTEICDVDGDNVGGQPTEDLLMLQCICTNTSFDVASVAPQCQSCMTQYPDDPEDVNDDLKDINEIVSRCGFSPATYSTELASSASAIVVVASEPTAASQLTTTISGAGQTAATTGSVSSTAATGQTTATGASATGTSTSGTSTASSSATGTSATSGATTTAAADSGASGLGSLHSGWAMMLTYAMGAAGLGAWLI